MDYKNIYSDKNNAQMGLNNKKCNSPKYFCLSKKIFLSADDVATKSCFHKVNADMLSEQKCNWLLNMNEYDEYRKKNQENAAAIKRHKKSSYASVNSAHDTYLKHVKSLLKNNSVD